MIEYEEEDFEGMTYKIYGLPGDQSIFKVYPNLKKIPELTFKVPHQTINLDRVIRYLMFFYDKGSPFIGIRDINERKEIALTHAGILPRSKKYSEVVEKIITGKNKDFNKAVIAYLRFCNNPGFSLVKVYEKMYYKNLERAENGELMDLSLINKQLRTLQEAEAKFLHNDDNRDLSEAFYDYIHAEELDLSPEGVVGQQIRNEEDYKAKKKSAVNKGEEPPKKKEIFPDIEEV